MLLLLIWCPRLSWNFFLKSPKLWPVERIQNADKRSPSSNAGQQRRYALDVVKVKLSTSSHSLVTDLFRKWISVVNELDETVCSQLVSTQQSC